MRYDQVPDYTYLPGILLEQVEHFFQHYKDLEPGKWVRIIRWDSAEIARQLIDEAVARAKQTE